MGKNNRIGQDSTEKIFHKSQWQRTLDKLRGKDVESFTMRNGYPRVRPVSNPPPYRQQTFTPFEDIQVVDKKLPMKHTDEKTMKDVGCCLKATNYVIGGFLVVSLILAVIAIATPYWFDTGTFYLGLFRYCSYQSTCKPISSFFDTAPDTSSNTWTLVTALTLAGMTLMAVSMLFYLIYSHCKLIDYRKVSCGVILAITVMLGAGCLLSSSAVMIWYHYNVGQIYTFGWSFAVLTSGGILAFITFFIMMIYACNLAFL